MQTDRNDMKLQKKALAYIHMHLNNHENAKQ